MRHGSVNSGNCKVAAHIVIDAETTRGVPPVASGPPRNAAPAAHNTALEVDLRSPLTIDPLASGNREQRSVSKPAPPYWAGTSLQGGLQEPSARPQATQAPTDAAMQAKPSLSVIPQQQQQQQQQHNTMPRPRQQVANPAPGEQAVTSVNPTASPSSDCSDTGAHARANAQNIFAAPTATAADAATPGARGHAKSRSSATAQSTGAAATADSVQLSIRIAFYNTALAEREAELAAAKAQRAALEEALEALPPQRTDDVEAEAAEIEAQLAQNAGFLVFRRCVMRGLSRLACTAPLRVSCIVIHGYAGTPCKPRKKCGTRLWQPLQRRGCLSRHPLR